jgi:putative membrane protein
MEPPVDSRLLQANERTLLAWIRTALALLTFGVLIARFGTLLVGAAFAALGLTANVFALIRYTRARRALLRNLPIPADGFPLAFGLLVAALGLLVAAYLLGAVPGAGARGHGIMEG